jgi:hypothetical protein
VDIVFFDGEDYGMEQDHQRYLIGSRHFARAKPPEYVPRFGILLDMVGTRFSNSPENCIRYGTHPMSFLLSGPPPVNWG